MRSECGRTTDVERATASGEWLPELAAHAVGCPSCGDTVTVLRFLGRLADGEREREPALPAAGTVLLRARVLDRLRRENDALERASLPLRVAGMAAGALGLGAAVLATAWVGAWWPPAGIAWASVLLTAALLVTALLAARSWGLDEG